MVVSSQRRYSELPTRCTPNISLFLDVSCLSSVTGLSRLSFSLFLKVTGNPEVNDVIIQFKLLNVDVISQAPLRLNQSQLDARSAALPRAWIVVFLTLPSAPSAPNIFHTDCDGNPLHPTSTGKIHVKIITTYLK
ncbi:hypothetical protein DPMN_103666 [Dreissena polymorpha]|uniref:Uncharacterized protein n=1 Tax=Dreissena polymorpha TaxID=45954 RepID=A0A9D4K2G0_DREPO|nr:hypothetical protein DPMN_103666 [Dreissena polymorpha]